MGKNSEKIALVYYRTSTHQQFKKISPDLQKQECLKLARKEGFEVDEVKDVYCDDESAFVGKKSKRDGFANMTKRWKEDERVSAIFIYDLSRLFRDVRSYHNYAFELELKGVELISIIEPSVRDTSPAGKLPAGIIALVNQYNSEVYGAKIKESLKFKAESGIYPGLAPFGYKNMREEGEGKRRAWIELDDKEAPWAKKALMMYSSGNYSIRKLAEELASEGFPTRNGKPLHLSVLERILKDKIYIGTVEWGGVINPNGQHEKIIDNNTFERVQLILAAHNKEANRKRKHSFLLRGLANCGECSCRWQAGYSTGKMGVQYGLYFCQKRRHGKPVQCGQSSISVDDLEEWFSNLFKQFKLSPEAAEKLRVKIKKSFGEKQQAYENARRGLLLSINNVKDSKKNAFLKFVAKEVDGETYNTALADLEKKEKEFNDKLGKLEGNMAHIMRALEIGVELTQDIYRAYCKASPPLKSVFAQAFFKEIKIRDEKIASVELNAPFDYVCYKKLKGNPVFNLAYEGGSGES